MISLVPVIKGKKQYFLFVCSFFNRDSTKLGLTVDLRFRLKDFFKISFISSDDIIKHFFLIAFKQRLILLDSYIYLSA